MAKRKKMNKMDVSLQDSGFGEIQIGTPPMAMFPARNFSFKVAKEEHKITIPRQGNYHELDPDFFPEEAGDFKLYDTDNNIMYLPSLTKILFAVKKYPDLKSNQLFMPIALRFNDDTVDIIGQVIEMLLPEEQTSTAK